MIAAADAPSLEWSLLLASVGEWPAAEVVSIAERGPDWDEVLRLAAWHRLAALLRKGLRDADVYERAPEGARTQLTGAYHVNVATEAARRTNLDALLCRMNEEHIPMMLLKGAALAETVYGEPGLRPMGDVDLLVPEDDVERAHRVLQGMGYALGPEHSEDHHHHLTPLTSPDGLVTFELHRGLMPPRSPLQLDVARFWSRARLVDGPGPPRLLPAPEDLLVHVCVHFARDRLRGSEGAVGQLCDVTHLIGTTELDWDPFCLDLRTPGIRAAVFLALLSAARLLGADVPPEVTADLSPRRPDMVVEPFIEQRVLNLGYRTGLSLTHLNRSSIRTLVRPPATPTRHSKRSRAEGAMLLLGRALTAVRQTVGSLRREGLRALRLDRQMLALYRDGEVRE